jgi:hypothetical protein
MHQVSHRPSFQSDCYCRIRVFRRGHRLVWDYGQHGVGATMALGVCRHWQQYGEYAGILATGCCLRTARDIFPQLNEIKGTRVKSALFSSRLTRLFFFSQLKSCRVPIFSFFFSMQLDNRDSESKALKFLKEESYTVISTGVLWKRKLKATKT